jgi:hypothetical protein
VEKTPNVRRIPLRSREGLAKDVHCKRNWQRFPFLTGDVGVTGSPSAISPELSGSIYPCLSAFVP